MGKLGTHHCRQQELHDPTTGRPGPVYGKQSNDSVFRVLLQEYHTSAMPCVPVGCHMQVDQKGPSNADGSSGGAVEQAEGAAFELTSTEYAAPFSLSASGEWHTASRCMPKLFEPVQVQSVSIGKTIRQSFG